MTRAFQILLAADELLGSMLFKGIRKDEDISGYMWRKQYKVRIFLIDLYFGKGHCQRSYENAPEYRA